MTAKERKAFEAAFIERFEKRVDAYKYTILNINWNKKEAK